MSFPVDTDALAAAVTSSPLSSRRNSVLAVILVGSHARGAARPDSDVDLVILTPEQPAWFRDTTWAAGLGAVVRMSEEDWGAVRSLRVWYADGNEVEFGFAAPSWLDSPLDAGTGRVLDDGYRILHDPSGRAEARLREAGYGL